MQDHSPVASMELKLKMFTNASMPFRTKEIPHIHCSKGINFFKFRKNWQMDPAFCIAKNHLSLLYYRLSKYKTFSWFQFTKKKNLSKADVMAKCQQTSSFFKFSQQ